MDITYQIKIKIRTGGIIGDTQNNSFEKNYPFEWPAISRGVNQILSDNGHFFSYKLNLEYVFVGDVNSHVVIEKPCWSVESHILRNDGNVYYFTYNKMVLFLDITTNIVAFIFAIILSVIIGVIVLFNNRDYSKIKYFS